MAILHDFYNVSVELTFEKNQAHELELYAYLEKDKMTVSNHR